MVERGPQSQELRGRMEEDMNLIVYSSQRLEETGQKLTVLLEEIGDSELMDAFRDHINATEDFERHQETGGWILAMRNAGLSDDLILKVLEEKDKRDDEDRSIKEEFLGRNLEKDE